MKKISYFLQISCILGILSACQSEVQDQENFVKPKSIHSSARVAQVGQGEWGIIQNGKMVGTLFVPAKDGYVDAYGSCPLTITHSHYKEYWALSKDYVYVNSTPNSGLELVPLTPQFENVQDFHTAMKAKFGTGKFITVDCVESINAGDPDFLK